MADKDCRLPDNAPGGSTWTTSASTATRAARPRPSFFARNDDKGYSFVHKQPTDEDGQELCLEALEGCPVEAIGQDGDAD